MYTLSRKTLLSSRQARLIHLRVSTARHFAGGSSISGSTKPYKSYEYPFATEPPEITRTTAAEAAGGRSQPDAAGGSNSQSTWFGRLFAKKEEQETLSSSDDTVLSTSSSSDDTSTAATADSNLSAAIEAYNDPFDDSESLSEEEVEKLRQQQKEKLSTKLSTLEPVTKTVPSYIPPNVPSTELATPETCISTLPNGVRVVSQETYGQVSTVGVVTELGSRHETVPGTTHLLEMLAFGASTDYLDASDVAHKLQDWGGTRFCQTAREQSVHAIDLLRPNVEMAMHLLSQTLTEPKFLDEEIEEAKQALWFQSLPENMPPELLLPEAMQQAAYGAEQQLGRPHFCRPEGIEDLTRQAVYDLWKTQVYQHPCGMVVGGAGIEHMRLVELAHKYFGHLEQNDVGRIQTVPSRYRGGDCHMQIPDLESKNDEGVFSEKDKERRYTRVAVALEVGGWHSDDLVPTCVLQTLLGGGSSFSAGGPGKGMYSRLYRTVLNRYTWAENAEAFTAFHNESGLWGITGSAEPARARELVKVFCQSLARVGMELVTEEELDRARNMLKCNVLTQLESRLILFEDISRQVLTYNKHENIQATCAKIDEVTAEDLQRLALKALEKPPTVAAVGVDVSNVPKQAEVAQWFRSTN